MLVWRPKPGDWFSSCHVSMYTMDKRVLREFLKYCKEEIKVYTKTFSQMPPISFEDWSHFEDIAIPKVHGGHTAKQILGSHAFSLR